ncbi:MAG: hypothetical protein ACE5GA_08040 [Candidatus Zixiibacteriota bacterium]
MYIVVMEIVWIIIGLLLLLALAAGLVPVRISFRLSSSKNGLKVLYGPFCVIDSDKSARKPRARKGETARKDRSSGRRRRLALRDMWDLFIESLKLVPGFGRAALDLAGRLFKRTEFSDFSGRLAGGLGDPALTGMAAGWVHSLFGAVPRVARHVSFEPDYLADWPVVELSGAARFRPISAAGPVFRFVTEAPLLGAFRLWRNKRRLSKKKSK